MVLKSFFLKFCLPIIFVLAVLDRLLKAYVEMVLRSIPEKTIPITSFFNITEVWNYGVSFGMFKADDFSGVIFLTVMATAIIGFLVYLLIKSETQLEAIAFSIIIGGALGNLYDRLVYNAVYDFLDIHYAGIHFWTFNPADVFISCGAGLLIIQQICYFFLHRASVKSSS